MLREELNEKDTWDLTTIFANNEEFEKAFNNANIEIENIKKYENIMINSSDELYQTTKTIYEVGEKIIHYNMLIIEYLLQKFHQQ